MNLPSQASVVVIGGGAMGSSTLYHLAKEGADAILLERNRLTSGSTWHAAGLVRSLRASKNLTNLIRYSIGLYPRLEEETGQSVGWINTGSLAIATTEDREIYLHRQAGLAGMFGVDASYIVPQEARERWPLMNVEDVRGAVWSPGDGRVNPSDLCAALIKGAKSAGARVFENTPVLGLLTQGGKVVGVETEGGQVRCDAVVLCAGLWSRGFAKRYGVSVPLWPCEHFYLLTKKMEAISGHLPSLVDQDASLYLRDESGGLLVGSFELDGKALNPARLGKDFAFNLLEEDWEHFEPMMNNALHRVPDLAHAEAKMLLNGPESFTADGMFMLGEATESPGLFLGCGMNSVGIVTSGGAGWALAHRIVHGSLPFALPEADPARFPPSLNDAGALCARAPEILGWQYGITYPGKQPRTARDLRPTPLHERWIEHKARFVQAYGWERPAYFGCESEPELGFGRPEWFGQVGAEVRQAHEEAAVFDLSPYGKISVAGPDAERFLDRLCVSSMKRLPGRAMFSLMLDPQGGIEADLVALRLSDEKYWLYVGTASIRRDLAWLRANLQNGERVSIRDQTDNWATLLLCGPKAMETALAAGFQDLEGLKYFGFRDSEVAGLWVRAARLSYTGEAGFEFTCRSVDAPGVYDRLYDAGARPAGTYAINSMRIEKRYYIYGDDLDADLTPFEVGLESFIDWNTRFVGSEALKPLREQGPSRRFVTITIEDDSATPHGNEPVFAGDRIVGRTTSASYGYRIGCPIALALVDTRDLPSQVTVRIGDETFAGEVVEGAAFDPAGDRVRAGRTPKDQSTKRNL